MYRHSRLPHGACRYHSCAVAGPAAVPVAVRTAEPAAAPAAPMLTGPCELTCLFRLFPLHSFLETGVNFCAICGELATHCALRQYPAGYFPQVAKLDTKSCTKLRGAPIEDFADSGKFSTCCYGDALIKHGYLTIGASPRIPRSNDKLVKDIAILGVSLHFCAPFHSSSSAEYDSTDRGKSLISAQSKMQRLQNLCEGCCFQRIKNVKNLRASLFLFR